MATLDELLQGAKGGQQGAAGGRVFSLDELLKTTKSSETGKSGDKLRELDTLAAPADVTKARPLAGRLAEVEAAQSESSLWKQYARQRMSDIDEQIATAKPRAVTPEEMNAVLLGGELPGQSLVERLPYIAKDNYNAIVQYQGQFDPGGLRKEVSQAGQAAVRGLKELRPVPFLFDIGQLALMSELQPLAEKARQEGLESLAPAEQDAVVSMAALARLREVNPPTTGEQLATAGEDMIRYWGEFAATAGVASAVEKSLGLGKTAIIRRALSNPVGRGSQVAQIQVERAVSSLLTGPVRSMVNVPAIVNDVVKRVQPTMKAELTPTADSVELYVDPQIKQSGLVKATLQALASRWLDFGFENIGFLSDDALRWGMNKVIARRSVAKWGRGALEKVRELQEKGGLNSLFSEIFTEEELALPLQAKVNEQDYQPPWSKEGLVRLGFEFMLFLPMTAGGTLQQMAFGPKTGGEPPPTAQEPTTEPTVPAPEPSPTPGPAPKPTAAKPQPVAAEAPPAPAVETATPETDATTALRGRIAANLEGIEDAGLRKMAQDALAVAKPEDLPDMAARLGVTEPVPSTDRQVEQPPAEPAPTPPIEPEAPPAEQVTNAVEGPTETPPQEELPPSLTAPTAEPGGTSEPRVTGPERAAEIPATTVASMPTADIHLDPKRFQYKIAWKDVGAEKWRPELAGVISVWRDPKDGKVYVVNGHRRVAMAQRLGTEALDVRFLNVDTPQEARSLGALINIAEGHGTVMDAAKFFRDSGYTPEQLKSQGVSLTDYMAAQGMALSRVSPGIWNAVNHGTMPVERAVIIGRELDNHTQQDALVKSLGGREKITNEELTELIQNVKLAGTGTTEVNDLFGTRALEQSYAIPRAKVTAYVRNGLIYRAATLNIGSREQRAEILREAGNQIDTDKNKRLSGEAAAVAYLFDTFKNKAGDVSAILTDAAKQIADGGDVNAVKRDALKRVGTALRADVAKAGRRVQKGGKGRSGGSATTAVRREPAKEGPGLRREVPSGQPVPRPAQPAAGDNADRDFAALTPEQIARRDAEIAASNAEIAGFPEKWGDSVRNGTCSLATARRYWAELKGRPLVEQEALGGWLLAELNDHNLNALITSDADREAARRVMDDEAVPSTESPGILWVKPGVAPLEDESAHIAVHILQLNGEIPSDFQRKSDVTMSMMAIRVTRAIAEDMEGAELVADIDAKIAEGGWRGAMDWLLSTRLPVVNAVLARNPDLHGVSPQTAKLALLAGLADERNQLDQLKEAFPTHGIEWQAYHAQGNRQYRQSIYDAVEGQREKNKPRDVAPGQGALFVRQEPGAPRGPPADPFYLMSRQAIQAWKQGAAPARQVSAYLKGRGVTADEFKWTGLDELLKDPNRRLTKQEVLDYIDQNAVKVEEVTQPKEETYYHVERVGSEWQVFDEADNLVNDGFETEEGAQDWIDSHSYRAAEPKYAQYQLPGGKGYRELLMTMPQESRTGYGIGQDADEYWRITEPDGKIDPRSPSYATEDEAREALAGYGLKAANWYQSSHWSEPNVLVHLRFNERTDADGKRVLFIEEIQSDWHQAGREQGYQNGIDWSRIKLERKGEPDMTGRYSWDVLEDGESIATAVASTEDKAWEQVRAQAKPTGVPPAPFAETWHELAFKRAVRWAAENGFDRVAWTTGEQQADRYQKLLKDVTEVRYLREGMPTFDAFFNGKDEQTKGYTIDVRDRNGAVVHSGFYTPTELKGVVGKQVAQDIIADKGTGKDRKVLSYPDGLTIGGEGFREFYDQKIGGFADKLSRKFGGKGVGQAEVNTGVFAYGVAANSTEVPSISITPAMRQSVMYAGQPLFIHREGAPESDYQRLMRQYEEAKKKAAAPAPGFENVGTRRTTEPIEFKEPSEMTDKELEAANKLDEQRITAEREKFAKESAARLADMTPEEIANLNRWSAGMTAPDKAQEFMHWVDEADRFTGTGQESAFSRLFYRARLDYGVKSMADLTPEQWEKMRVVAKDVATNLRQGERRISWLGRAALPDATLEELEKRSGELEHNLIKRVGAIRWPWNSFTAELRKAGGEYGVRLASMLDGYHYGNVSMASEHRAIFNDAVKPMLVEFKRSADLFGRKRQKALDIVFAYGEGIITADDAIAEIKTQTGRDVDKKLLDTIHNGMGYFFAAIKARAARLGVELQPDPKTYFPHSQATPETPKWQRNWERTFWDKRLDDPHTKTFMHRYYDLLDKGVDPHGDENFIEYAKSYAKYRLDQVGGQTETLDGMETPDKRAAKLVAAWGFAARDPAWLPIYSHFRARAEVPFPFWSYSTDAVLNYIDGTARYLSAISYLGEPPTAEAMPPYLAELLQGVLERNRSFGRKAADYIRNVILHPPPLDYEWWDKAIDALNTYELVRLGPTFTVKNALQSVVNNPEYNLADWAVGIGKSAQLAWELASKAEQHGRPFKMVDLVREAATVSEMQNLEVMGLQGRGPIGTVISAHYKLIGGHTSEAINRAVSTVMVPHKAEKFARRLIATSEGKGKRLWRYREQAYQDYFRQMGIEPEEVVARGLLRPEDLARVAHGANRLSQFLATAKDVPRWWGTIPKNATQRSLKRALLMFQRFNYLQAAKVSRLASDAGLFIRTGGRRGNVGSLIAFSVMAYITTLLAREVLNRIKGRRADWEELVPRSQVAKLFTLMQYTGHYGMWLDGLQVAVIGDKAFDFSTGPVLQEVADLSKLLSGIREDIGKGQPKDVPQEIIDWGLSRTSTFGVLARMLSPAAQRRAAVFDYGVTARELYKAYGALWRNQGDAAAKSWWESEPVKEFRDRYQQFSGKMLVPPSDKAMKARIEGDQTPPWERREEGMPGRSSESSGSLTPPYKSKWSKSLYGTGGSEKSLYKKKP